MDERLVVNVSRFAHETVDGETILIDAETGHLLLLTGFASVLFDHLIGGGAPAGIAAVVEGRFGSEAGSATRTFLQELRTAGILVQTTEPAPSAGAPPAWPERFSVPVVERYDDIAKIIAMDPIHEVGVPGWPRPADDYET
jgi:hypothetical protein